MKGEAEMKQKSHKNCSSSRKNSKRAEKDSYGYRPTGDRNSDCAKSPNGGSSIKNKNS